MIYVCSVYHDFISQFGAFKPKMNILRNETQVDKRSGVIAFLIMNIYVYNI